MSDVGHFSLPSSKMATKFSGELLRMIFDPDLFSTKGPLNALLGTLNHGGVEGFASSRRGRLLG